MDEIKLLSEAGPSALLAVIAYLLFKAYREDRQKSEERIAQQCDNYRLTLIENTEAMTKLGDQLDTCLLTGECRLRPVRQDQASAAHNDGRR